MVYFLYVVRGLRIALRILLFPSHLQLGLHVRRETASFNLVKNNYFGNLGLKPMQLFTHPKHCEYAVDCILRIYAEENKESLLF